MARKKAAAENSGSTLSRAIRKCVDSGKVSFGMNSGVKKALSGSAKLLVIAGNCPGEISRDVSRFCRLSGIPVIRFDGTSMDLGTIVGRPHGVAMMCVLDPGNSGILELAKQ